MLELRLETGREVLVRESTLHFESGTVWYPTVP